ncbi:hypothetical protein [Actinocatenispora comari]|uniref:hypothetical protein n=1 Tax=Actinocatenispora comari TaxID=2807577 RepID=UPI001A92DF3E|nr:hypothetical protein [Actinocatenispora comari]
MPPIIAPAPMFCRMSLRSKPLRLFFIIWIAWAATASAPSCTASSAASSASRAISWARRLSIWESRVWTISCPTLIRLGTSAAPNPLASAEAISSTMVKAATMICVCP